MPYQTWKQWETIYIWNLVHPKASIDLKNFDAAHCYDRVAKIHQEEIYYHINCLDDGIFQSSTKFFISIGARWCNLPLTTRMISSPGEVYAWETLDYTTDALPIELPKWFWHNKRIFLSESSQFYLELALLAPKIHHVFSIYNSFRKESSDATHLSEFQHIEFEWKTDLTWCKKIALGLVDTIFQHLVRHNKDNLLFFLDAETLEKKRKIMEADPITIAFKDALDMLYIDTKDEKYKLFSMEHFWSREEIRLTELLGANVFVEKFPMLQIPFYHDIAEEEYNWTPLAKNADLILYGYRETIWAWERIKNKEVLLKKAEIFNLPVEDYLPYTSSRDFEDYIGTSWFWLWRQRLVQRLTNQPYIYDATLFPRTHLLPNP